MERIGVAIVGGGAVGLAVARELASSGYEDVFVLERMPNVGDVQSGRNSGVIHAGVYYRPGSVKAELCVAGNRLLYELAERHGVAARRTGKLIVAADEGERPALEELARRAGANGVAGTRLLTRSQVRRLEPNVEVPAALHLPSTGIVDAAVYTTRLAELARAAGARVETGWEVVHVEPGAGGFAVTGRRAGREETIGAEILVNSAGLDCDRIARMVDPGLELELVPLRGEYYRFNRRRRAELWLEGLNVYPVPEPLDLGDEQPMMVGVHLTPTFSLERGRVAVGDTVTVGPEFVVVGERDDYERDRKPAEHFLARARRFFPHLRLADLEPDFAGIMVHLKGAGDWEIRRDHRWPDCIQLLGIDSPGLTGSLAIARRVRELLRS